jgi:hypothetical protein
MAGPADGRRRRECGGWSHRGAGDGGQDAASMAGRKPGHGTDDTADSHGRLGIDCAVTHREITSRDDTGRGGDGWPRRGAGGGADHVVALTLTGAGPMGRTARPHLANPGDPRMMRAGGTP